MSKGVITTENCTPEDMSYYTMIRETIHGLDNLITATIRHSVTIITGALGLGVALSPIIPNPYWGVAFLFLTTVVALILTWGSHQRVNLYADMLAEQVAVAEMLEDQLLLDIIPAAGSVQKKGEYSGIKITKRIEQNVGYAGKRGKIIFKIGIIAFYTIEAAIFLYLIYRVLSFFFCWEVTFGNGFFNW